MAPLRMEKASGDKGIEVEKMSGADGLHFLDERFLAPFPLPRGRLSILLRYRLCFVEAVRLRAGNRALALGGISAVGVTLP